jgi:prepilin peptidase CpaA
MPVLEAVFTIAVATFTLTAAVTDQRSRKVPNWLTVPAFVAALVVHAAAGGLTGLGFSLLGFSTGFGLLFLLWLLGGSGGGDVKLMGALGAWLGPRLTVLVFLASAVVIVLMTLGAMAYGLLARGMQTIRTQMRSGSLSHATGAVDQDARRAERQRFRILPYAVPVALSTWLVLAAAWLAARLPV